MIEVIDYGGGNIGSMQRCLDRLELDYQMVDGKNPPTGENPLLFPGVGAFGATMYHLKEVNLIDRIQGMVREGVPYLGVCIGLQVLFEWSEEARDVKGLGLLPGIIKKYTTTIGKVPQIGWNKVTRPPHQHNSPYDDGHVYFVNSYHPVVEEPTITLYNANYYGTFCAAVQYKHMTACQFHPEKSGEFGHDLIKRWALQYV